GDPRVRGRPAARRGGLPGRAARLHRHALRPHARDRARQALLPRQDAGLRARAPLPRQALSRRSLRGPDPPPRRRAQFLGRVVLRRRLPGGTRPQPDPGPLRPGARTHAAREAGAVRARPVRGAGARPRDPLPPRLRSPRHPVRGADALCSGAEAPGGAAAKHPPQPSGARAEAPAVRARRGPARVARYRSFKSTASISTLAELLSGLAASSGAGAVSTASASTFT